MKKIVEFEQRSRDAIVSSTNTSWAHLAWQAGSSLVVTQVYFGLKFMRNITSVMRAEKLPASFEMLE